MTEQETDDERGVTLTRRDALIGMLGSAGVFGVGASQATDNPHESNGRLTAAGGPMSTRTHDQQIRWIEGSIDDRPSAGVEGRYYHVTDPDDDEYGQIYKDDGTAWNSIPITGLWETQSGAVSPRGNETIGDGTTTADHQSLSTDELSNATIASGDWSDVKTKIENAGFNEVVVILSADSGDKYTADQQIQVPSVSRLNIIFNSPMVDIQTNDPALLFEGVINATVSGSVAVRHSSSETGSFIKATGGSGRLNFGSLAINGWVPKGHIYEMVKDGNGGAGPYITGPVVTYKQQETPVRLFSDGSLGNTSHACIIGPLTCSTDIQAENGESAIELINAEDVMLTEAVAAVGGVGVYIEGKCEAVYMDQLDVASLTAESLKITDNADGGPMRIFANHAVFGPGGVRGIDIKAKEVWFNTITTYDTVEDGVLIRDGSDRVHILGGQIRHANDGENADTFGINIEDGGSKRVVVKDVHFRDSKATAHIHWGDGSRDKGVMRDCDLDGSADNLVRNLPRHVSGNEGIDVTVSEIETGLPIDQTGLQVSTLNTPVDVEPNRVDIHGEIQALTDNSVEFGHGPFFTEANNDDLDVRYNISSAGSSGSEMEVQVMIEHNSPKVGDI